MTATRVLRIDGIRADLVPIAWMGVDSRGTIVVSQGQDGRLLYFTEAGVRTGTFGRVGRGPEEFAGVSALGWVGDTIWLYDRVVRRLTFVAPSRTLLRTTTLSLAQPAAPPKASPLPQYAILNPIGYVAPNDYVVLALPAAGRSAASKAADGVQILRFNAVANTAQTVATLAPDPTDVTVRTMGGQVGASAPFPLTTHYALAQDSKRVVVLESTLADIASGVFRVTAIRMGGDTVFHRRLPFDPESIPRRVADSAISARAAKIRNRSLAQKYKASVPIPSAYPPALGVLVGRDGTIWIRQRLTADGSPYLMLAPDGATVGRVVVPPSMRIMVAEASTIWGVESDSDGVESIVRYRIGAREVRK